VRTVGAVGGIEHAYASATMLSPDIRLVVISTWPPRRCGLASYTADLVSAMSDVAPNWRIKVCALDRDRLRYGPEVVAAIGQDRPEDYRRAAQMIAEIGTDLVLIQHEYGIFGGPDGSHLLHLTNGLRRRAVPYAMTLHTVLADASTGKAAVARSLCASASTVTVLTESARRLAVQTALIDVDRIAVVPHGAPPALREPVDPSRLRQPVYDALADARGGTLLSTFGLIGPGKGLEIAIQSLPAIVARRPDVRYLIAGATHPEIARTSGEGYRQTLSALARRLGMDEHVRFLDTYLTDEELATLLARTDLFITPYRGREQACSGALTFAVAAGCPVVSTPYLYAQDLLTDHGGAAPGVLVPHDDPPAMANAVLRLLDDAPALLRARHAAHALGATLTWPLVATNLAATLHPRARRPRRDVRPQPPVSHLCRLVDQVGVARRAIGDQPDQSCGYRVDDAARLAVVAVGLLDRPGHIAARALTWLRRAVRFLADAAEADGVRNERAYDGRWLDEPSVGDHCGRALWGLCTAATSAAPVVVRRDAEQLAGDLLPLVPKLASLRASAYAILGLSRLPVWWPDVDGALRYAADALVRARDAPAGGRWFDSRLAFDGARLPHALMAAGIALEERGIADRGLDALDWYLERVGLADRVPVLHTGEGNQSPADTAATVDALVQAWRVTGDTHFARLARRAYGWFSGINRAGIRMCDPDTGACRDRLSATDVAPNAGAEATLAYHQARLAVDELPALDTRSDASWVRGDNRQPSGYDIDVGDPHGQ
jgi:glycosyltransferase involved in cell wall biosynthesis